MSLLKYESELREPLIDGDKNYHQVTEDIIGPIETKPTTAWWIGLSIALALLGFGVYSVSFLNTATRKDVLNQKSL